MRKTIKSLFRSKNDRIKQDRKIKMVLTNPDDYEWAKKFCETVLVRDDQDILLKQFTYNNISFLTEYHEFLQELLENKSVVIDVPMIWEEMYSIWQKSHSIINKEITSPTIDSIEIEKIHEIDEYYCLIGHELLNNDNIFMDVIYDKFDNMVEDYQNTTTLEFTKLIRTHLYTYALDCYRYNLNQFGTLKRNIENNFYNNFQNDKQLHFYKKNKTCSKRVQPSYVNLNHH